MTIGTRVDDEFGAAVAYFAKMDGMSIADYARASLQRKAVRMIQDRTASYDEKRRVAGLMDDALKNGTWKQVLADSPDTFPSTKDEWKKQIEKYSRYHFPIHLVLDVYTLHFM